MITDVLKQICDNRGITFAQLADGAGVPRNTIYNWRKGVAPNIDSLKAVADYLNISVDTLLERNNYWELTEKDKKDIGIKVESIMEDLSTDEYDINYFGEPMTEEEKAQLRLAIKIALETNKMNDKKKFTPKKYRN
ncbi:helix-turn-helix transcriptional regulator [Aerococcaceae bacterium zg-B36]|uniref:helix-turn-helix domain-containing protein n=1 Tax=Aerococcaceae bacterium zg-252 TaxID=2796928 RepID=UPI001BD8A111|nr:helix-turn-helix transcriptional regulator [Aerococcaceae bacterium zg-B36]